MIQNLSHELTVLSKSIEHKNLSAAAAYVGLSQPQLSRLIAKIETDLNVVLLDRSSRRKSGWTPLAYDLVKVYNAGVARLESDILSIATDREMSELRVGSLEGLSFIASQFVKQCFDNFDIPKIHLDVFDFNELDSHFLNDDFDLIFTVRLPSKRKFSHLLEVGYQFMKKYNSDPTTFVVSPYEIHNNADSHQIAEAKKVLISNSLRVRSHWLNTIGGCGSLPVDTKKGQGKGHHTVYLLGSELISPLFWKKAQSLF